MSAKMVITHCLLTLCESLPVLHRARQAFGMSGLMTNCQIERPNSFGSTLAQGVVAGRCTILACQFYKY